MSYVRLLESGYQPASSVVRERIARVLTLLTKSEAPAVTPGLRESSGRQARHGAD